LIGESMLRTFCFILVRCDVGAEAEPVCFVFCIGAGMGDGAGCGGR